MNEVRWLLVGAGAISSKRVAPALAVAADSELKAIFDIRESEAKNLASEYSLKEYYTDYDRALDESGTDAVYLATPVWLHVEQAVKALEAGKHVLIEKPLGLTGAECRRAIAAARASGKKSACAYFRRFYPRYEYTREMLKSGEFGQVVAVRLTFCSWFAPSPDQPGYWRVVRGKSGGGPLSDMGSHMFDVLIGLFGLPVSVYAKCENLVHRWDVEDSASIIMKLRNGAQVVASFNWNSKAWRHEFEIIGTESKIDWFPYDTGMVVKTAGREVHSLDLPNAENVHLPLIENFVQAIVEDRSPRVSLEEAALTNFLLDAIYRSSSENREICL